MGQAQISIEEVIQLVGVQQVRIAALEKQLAALLKALAERDDGAKTKRKSK